MIDVHVLTHGGTRQDWLDQCLASLDGHPINVFVVDNDGKSVGAGRATGYTMGTSKFVAYVDSDDYVLPGSFAACLEALHQHRSVVTMERVEYEDGRVYPFSRPGHAITVYRREDIQPLVKYMEASAHTTDANLRRLLQPFQLPIVGYVWRVHAGGDHHAINNEVFTQESGAWPTQTEQRQYATIL